MTALIVRQSIDLTARYCRLQLLDSRNLFLLFVQAPAIALMNAATFGVIRVSFVEQHAADTKQVFFLLVIAVLWCSSTLSVREVVKELPLVMHERRFGLALIPYLLSKFTFLGLIALIQATLLLIIVRDQTQLTGHFTNQLVVLSATALAGVALELCVSCLVGTTERAMTVLPITLIGLAIFSGGLARLNDPCSLFAKIFVPAYWSLDGLRAGLSSDLKNATYPGSPGHFQAPILGPGGPVLLSLGMLILHTLVSLLLTYISLYRRVRQA